MKNLEFRKNLRISILVTLLAVIPGFVQAFSFEEFFSELQDLFSEEWFSGENNKSQVINEINVSTNTGDTVINGEIKEGETKSQIFVKNIINGEEIDPIDIESDANEVKVESEIKVENNKVIVHREIQIDSETSVEDYEVDLESSEDEGDEGVLDVLQEWWSDFIENLKSFFQNIFNF